jgi:NAD(P)H-hydrate epimerase
MYPENELYVGQFHVLDLGLSKMFEKNTPAAFQYLQKVDIDFIKPRAKFSHKGSFGHALLIAGSKGKMGAAILASQACLQSGSGLLTSYCPELGQIIIQIAVPEGMNKTYSDPIDFEDYACIGIGPGLSTNTEAKNILATLLAEYSKPIVVDADALTLLGVGHELSYLPANSILTPHPKEFDRLFGDSISRAHQIQKGLTFASQHQVYIILKGAHTAIICPDGQVIFNSTGNPAMAKGGSGDVLTGMLTAFLAQGYSSKEACILGVFLHGLAADLALLKTSECSMLPSDLIANIGKAYREVTNC